MKYKVQDLFIYPVKSLGGSRVPSFRVGPRGPQYDRQWMLIDEKGKFVSQRTVPKLSQLSAKVVDDARVEIHVPGDFMDFGVDEINKPEPIEVEIWDSKCLAQEVDEEVSDWVSALVDQKLRLVKMKDDFVRPIGEKYGEGQVGFADGFPFLILSQQSLDLLNQKVGKAFSVRRFRPNILVRAEQPHDEDQWENIEIGGVRLRGAKLCTRCKITTIDPLKGEFSTDNEPLATLGEYRKVDGGIVFGKNFVHENQGEIQSGQEIKIRG